MLTDDNGGEIHLLFTGTFSQRIRRKKHTQNVMCGVSRAHTHAHTHYPCLSVRREEKVEKHIPNTKS